MLEVICATCGSGTRAAGAHEVAPGCQSCGAPLRVLEPLVVRCGWCHSENRRDQTASCERCAGPLPALPGGEPGPRPPDAPRELPEGYRWRVLLWKNVQAFIGAAFVIVFCWSVIFPLIGAPLWYFAHRRAKRWLFALETGRATRARLTRVAVDHSQSDSGKHPWRIDYELDLHEQGTGKGFCEAWDPVNSRRRAGDVVWVVYAKDAHGHLASAAWPPLH